MILSVDSLCFDYGSRAVLKDVSFASEERSVISVLGSNGAGKTTLLKCLCNVLRPRSGGVSLDGRSLLTMSGRELATYIGYVPQTVPVSRMTVFDAVLVGRKPHIELAVSKEDIAIASGVIDAMGLGALSLRYLNQLSGGEFQKVQIARALAQEPRVLVLDEPSNNLDIANQHRTMELVRSVVHSHGVGAVMTMHDINLAIQYSDRFLFLAEGRVEAYGGIEVIDEALMRRVYGIDAEIIEHRGKPLVVGCATAAASPGPSTAGAL